MMNMSPAILNYTVKFNQTVAAVQYNDTNSSFSSLHCVFISRSLRFITAESPRLLLLMFSSLRCDGFDFRAEVRIRLCSSVTQTEDRKRKDNQSDLWQINIFIANKTMGYFFLNILGHNVGLFSKMLGYFF